MSNASFATSLIHKIVPSKVYGRSWRRTALLKLVNPSRALDGFAAIAAARPRNPDLTICTGVSGEPYTTMAMLLAFSLIRHERRLPTLRILYDGPRPLQFDALPFVELERVEYDEAKFPVRALEFWNFVGKPQSMVGATTPLAAWVDSDLFFLHEISPLLRGNAFIPMGERVGGGFYCLDAETRKRFFHEVLRARDELGIRDDRPCMKRAIDRLDLKFDALPDTDVRSSSGAERHWTHLSRGKARSPRYALGYLRETRKLLDTPTIEI